jgi:hypothetical protein
LFILWNWSRPAQEINEGKTIKPPAILRTIGCVLHTSNEQESYFQPHSTEEFRQERVFSQEA